MLILHLPLRGDRSLLPFLNLLIRLDDIKRCNSPALGQPFDLGQALFGYS